MSEIPELHDLIDIGVNLTNKAFARDLQQVLERACHAGINAIVVTGTSVAASGESADLAAEWNEGHRSPNADTDADTDADLAPVLYATAGVHPHDAKSCDESTMAALRGLAARPEVVAIGECGLDFDRNFSPPEVQLRWFEAQVELAAELQMPLFLHERAASSALLDIIRRHRANLPAAVVHCFTGSEAELDAYLALDLHIGITGWICDERRGTHLHPLVGKIPRDRLMLETDAPYLLPRTILPKPKHRRNEPAFLPHVLEKVAQCVGRPAAQVAAETTATATAFFALP